MGNAHGEVLILDVGVVFWGEPREPLVQFPVVLREVINVVVICGLRVEGGVICCNAGRGAQYSLEFLNH